MRVGLTGGIASGKSTVAGVFASRGAVVVDADEVSRSLTDGPGAVMDALVGVAGPSIVDRSGGLDRPALAERLFADGDLRAAVEAILHPAIRADVARRFDDAGATNGSAIGVVEAALLVETSDASGPRMPIDCLVVVEAPRAVKLSRQMARDGRSRGDAEARLAAQASAGRKALASDFVVWNDASLDELLARADEVWRALVRRAEHA